MTPHFRAYVDVLLEHAQGALWPERRAALENFYQGISRCSASDLKVAAEALGLETGSDDGVAELIFQRILTAYLSCLDEREVTNPDQAQVYQLSFDPSHLDLAQRWAQKRPEPTSER